MILGVTILRKKYPLAKYLCVLLIVTGVAMFLYKPNKTSAVADDHVFGFGEILLVSPPNLKSLYFTCIIIINSHVLAFNLLLTSVVMATLIFPRRLSHDLYVCCALS